MRKRNYMLNIILVLVIGIFAIYISINGEFDNMIDAFKNASLFWIIIMFIGMFFYYLFDAFSLQKFAKVFKKDYSLKQSLSNCISAYFFNGITPFASGGQFAQVYIFNKQGINPTHSASILLLSFICYQSVLVLYTAIILLIRLHYFISNEVYSIGLVLLGFFINLVVIIVLFSAANSKRIQNFIIHKVIKLLYKIHIVKDYELTAIRIERYLSDFREQLYFLQNNRNILIQVVFNNFIKLTIAYMMPFLATKAICLSVSYNQLLDFMTLCSCIYMITAFIPIPGSSGGAEGLYMVMYGFLGTVGASSSMMLWRFMTYYLGLILGVLTFSFSREISNKRLEE
ncbi:MAG: flippase-like domain-containing protein [Erysipelotrichaceae bacterium]|nr:flippase-like domain-containing protein [Erysipelotrichaceae bacterium]